MNKWFDDIWLEFMEFEFEFMVVVVNVFLSVFFHIIEDLKFIWGFSEGFKVLLFESICRVLF